MPKENSQFPELQHNSLQELFVFDTLNESIIKSIEALPKDSLIADLELILKNAIENRKWYFENEDEMHSFNFVIHTFIVLKHLKSSTSLPLILEVLSIEVDYLEFYFGDLLCEDIWSVIFELGKDDLDTLLHFMTASSATTFAKTEVAVAVSQIIYDEPERRKEVLDWFEKVLEHFASLTEKNIDYLLIGLIISSAMDINAVSLSTSIKKLYDIDYVDIEVNGDWEEVEAELLNEDYITDPRTNLNIFEFYKDWESKINMNFDWQNSDIYIPQQPIKKEQKIGRNEPCPCGSGKKYKRCCLDLLG